MQLNYWVYTYGPRALHHTLLHLRETKRGIQAFKGINPYLILLGVDSNQLVVVSGNEIAEKKRKMIKRYTSWEKMQELSVFISYKE
jgi:hypothetical protein